MSGKAACFDKSLFLFLHSERDLFLIGTWLMLEYVTNITRLLKCAYSNLIEQKKANYFEMVLKCGFQLDLKYWFFTSTFIVRESRKVPILNLSCTKNVSENVFGQVD